MPYVIDEVLMDAIKQKASDVHLTVAMPPLYRINGQLHQAGEKALTPEDTK
ncbi:MAG: type IV pili twitching motility protein PilT, partial [Clostridiales bacterium]|nr:type IV pili twitching motility protein PilT [Clostridiales bacterium]